MEFLTQILREMLSWVWLASIFCCVGSPQQYFAEGLRLRRPSERFLQGHMYLSNNEGAYAAYVIIVHLLRWLTYILVFYFFGWKSLIATYVDELILTFVVSLASLPYYVEAGRAFVLCFWCPICHALIAIAGSVINLVFL